LESQTPLLRAQILAAFATIYLVWGSSYMAGRIAVHYLPALLMAGVRFGTAGLIMLILARVSGDRIWLKPPERMQLSILAVLGFVIANGAGVWALQYVASNKSALLNATVPCWIVLLGTFGPKGYRPRWRTLLGLLLGFCGAALVLQPRAEVGSSELFPELMILCGCIAWAFSTMCLRRFELQLPIKTLIGWQMLLGGAGLALLGVAGGDAERWHWSWPGVVALCYLIIFASCLAHTAYAWLATRTTPAHLGTYSYVNPLVATTLGWLVLDERLTPIQLLGMVVSVSGVLAINWPQRMQRQPKS
jgi:drug/metabolite transporter (DMT)-like permease